MLHRFANPTRFLRLANAVLPWATGLTVILIGAGLYFAFGASPADYQQGETVRIMYVHVPSAWMAMFAYAFIAVASTVGLIWKHPVAHVCALAAAPWRRRPARRAAAGCSGSGVAFWWTGSSNPRPSP